MMKTEGYMVNQLTTTLVQVTALVLVIHTKVLNPWTSIWIKWMRYVTQYE